MESPGKGGEPGGRVSKGNKGQVVVFRYQRKGYVAKVKVRGNRSGTWKKSKEKKIAKRGKKTLAKNGRSAQQKKKRLKKGRSKTDGGGIEPASSDTIALEGKGPEGKRKKGYIKKKRGKPASGGALLPRGRNLKNGKKKEKS